MRTKLGTGTLQLMEVLSTLSEEIQEWMTPLAMQERTYGDPKAVLGDLFSAWQRQTEGRQWQELKGEIDLMIEGQVPLDPQKIQKYNELSRRLKGSKPDLNMLREAPLHG
jgi:hypothetical protein